MGFSQWEIFTSTADAQIEPEVVSPIDGASSFRFHKNDVGNNRNAAMRRVDPGQDKLASGALTFVLNPKLAAHAGAGDLIYGVSFLWQADLDPTNGANTVPLYLAGYRTGANAGAGGWGFWRYDNRLSVGLQVIHESPAAPAVAQDSPFVLDVEWRQDPTFIQGVQCLLSVNTGAINLADPYTGLTQVFTAIDPASGGALMGASNGEGFAWHAVNTPIGTGEVLIIGDKIRGESSAQV